MHMTQRFPLGAAQQGARQAVLRAPMSSRVYASQSTPQQELAQQKRSVDAWSGSRAELDLWRVLLRATAQRVASAVDAASAVAASNAARLRRMLVEPPPAGFPPGPPGEQVAALLGGPLEFLQRTKAQYGGVVGLLLGAEHVVLVADSEAAKQVMIEQTGDVFVKKGTAFFPGSSLAGNGLLVSDGDVWQRQRRLSNPSFRRAAVEKYADAMVAATQRTLATWQDGQTRDVYADFNQMTLQITLEALFGCSLEAPQPPAAAVPNSEQGAPHQPQKQEGQAGSLPHTLVIAEGKASAIAAYEEGGGGAGGPTGTSSQAERIITCITTAFQFFTRRAGAALLLPEWLPTWDNLEFASAVAQLDKVLYGIIGERRQQLAASHQQQLQQQLEPPHELDQEGGLPAYPRRLKQDLLQTLLSAVDEEDGSGMTDQALRDELMTLLVAGQETSAILLGWGCALLAHHPDVQAQAAAEVLQVVGTSRPPTAADMRALPVLESVVLEALRLHAPAYLVGRCATRDVTLRVGGPIPQAYTILAGTTILVSPYLMHREASAWGEDASQFRPQRWRHWQAQAGQAGFMQLLSGLGPNGWFLPFGAGPRNCIGTGFAMMEAVLVLAAVLQRHELRLASPGAPFPAARPQVTLRPESVQLLLRLRRR